MSRFLPLASACILALPVLAYGHGEGGGNFPNWDERVMHQLINRARVDPAAALADCDPEVCLEAGCYPAARVPLGYHAGANRAARFHAMHMVEESYLTHPSSCTLRSDIDRLFPQTCDGKSASCCVDGVNECRPDCTSFDARLELFGFAGGLAGEIITSYTDPEAFFTQWFFNPADSSACAISDLNGSRAHILSMPGTAAADYTGLGVGYDAQTLVQDFRAAHVPRIPSGIHLPRSGSDVRFMATWYDETVEAVHASVVLDGSCQAMTLERGTVNNGSWLYPAPELGDACHRYVFRFVDARGAVELYPTSGTLGAGPDSACPIYQRDPVEGFVDCPIVIVDAGAPDLARPDTARPDLAQPDTWQPDAWRLDTAGADRSADGGVLHDAQAHADASAVEDAAAGADATLHGDGAQEDARQRQVVLGQGFSCSAARPQGIAATLLLLALWLRRRQAVS